MSKAATTPRLTIGLPVYNGERFLARALDSLLAQDFADFVLLVSDNASTDATPDILADYAVLDERVCIVRQHRNLGASPNWCWVARKADTELFTWAACDDEYAPSFLSRCITLLDADPGIVLAYTGTVDIDEEGRRLREWGRVLPAGRSGSGRPVPRAGQP
jgi:glycosyltransferase involved in cell wall biosynthesis